VSAAVLFYIFSLFHIENILHSLHIVYNLVCVCAVICQLFAQKESPTGAAGLIQ